MPSLIDITAQFPGREWQNALAAPIRQGEIDRTLAGRLLHDEIGPLLSAAGLQLKVLSLDFPDASGDLRSRVSEIQELLDRAMEHVRSVSRTLSPSSAERAGLRYALERLAGDARENSGVQITLDCAGNPGVPETRALFRMGEYCVQYACGCGATAIHFRVEKRVLGWILEVLYDESSPQGGEEAKAKHRYGLIVLTYQAMRCGVSVELEDAPTGAKVIRVTHPAGPDVSDASR